MKKYFNTPIGRLRLIGFLEGLSLILLVLVAMPLKYFADSPGLVKSIGPAHGLLFMMFVFVTLHVAFRYKMGFLKTFLVLLSCMVPFGTFIADHKILKEIHQKVETDRASVATESAE